MFGSSVLFTYSQPDNHNHLSIHERILQSTQWLGCIGLLLFLTENEPDNPKRLRHKWEHFVEHSVVWDV